MHCVANTGGREYDAENGVKGGSVVWNSCTSRNDTQLVALGSPSTLKVMLAGLLLFLHEKHLLTAGQSQQLGVMCVHFRLHNIEDQRLVGSWRLLISQPASALDQ